MPSDGSDAHPRDIVLLLRSGCLQHININHRHYDALSYVLFHLYGGDGWHLNIPRVIGIRMVTARQFYAHRLMDRDSATRCTHFPVSITSNI